MSEVQTKPRIISGRSVLRSLCHNPATQLLTVRQAAIFASVCSAGADGRVWTMRGLSIDIGVDAPIVTRAVDALELQKLVVRKVRPSDTRVTEVHPTPEGVSLWQEITS